MSEDSNEKIETGCGFQLPWQTYKSRINFKRLQCFANIKFAVVMLCLGNFINHCVISGLYAMSISTIEKRFQLQSTEMGLVAGSYDLAAILGTCFMIVYGVKRHIPIWTALGLYLMAIGCFIFIIPHFIAPTYIPIENIEINLCSNASSTSIGCAASGIRNLKYIFAAALFIFSLGSVTIYSFAAVYIDENSTKEQTAIYIAFYYSMGALGPAVGFVGGGATLNLYTYIGQEPDGLTSSSYAWVGAWWTGFVVSGAITIIVATVTYMLPKSMPGSEELRKNRNDEMQADNTVGNEELREIADNVYKSMKYLFKNKCLMLCIAGNAANFAFIYGFNTFGAKYLESQLGLSPFTASVVYGISSILAAVVSQLLSGWIIAHYKLNVQQIIKFILVCSVISACFSFGLFTHCPDTVFAGATVPYHGSNDTGLTSPCNANCTCSTDIYEPVCGSSGITYFSPCFAGCSGIHDNGSFSECSCISTIPDKKTSSGICSKEYCKMIPLFMACMFFATFTSLMTFSPSIQVTLRCVPFDLRVRAISLNRILSYIFGTIPGRILTGLFVDLACAAWQTDCGTQGSCVVYNRWEMARNLSIVLLVETWFIVVINITMLLVYVPQGTEDTPDAENEEDRLHGGERQEIEQAVVDVETRENVQKKLNIL